MELSERKRKILAAVVELYIATGEPVGSKSLCDTLNFRVSPATVRNEMSELSSMGLLEQPHTSAGRVPSQKGYRVYIDSLMKRRPISQEEKQYLDSMILPSAYDPEKLLEGVAKVLASMTKYAAVSTTPSGEDGVIRAIQLVQTSRRTAMVILMTSAGTMKSRVFHCDFDLTPEILRVFFRLLNEKLVGVPVISVTPAYMQTLAASLGDMAMMMSSALMAVAEAARESAHSDVCLNGEVNLLIYPEFRQEDIRRIVDFLSRPADLCKLLSRGKENTKVLIGLESQRPELQDSSVIVSRYSIGNRDAGAIAVIGPTRMDYGKIITNMEYLSSSVGRMLTELMDLD
ncbi:MAG: Heat-inducible transcription repressor HrcA [Thermocaproicibacter melissae]|uniref:heat-inducible transcriptional repressor HrcA n=1 Tax=Thermocaproicibacter melissae TaxID=2966552 RepID=UPI0024B03BD4|nr:heat-inducible transcriptional repressor HrcA [Thermocaproicibacter melissae]WBY63876.1 heat-inducible transcriptional repressor HrcA [Thermocaproicibacter melissae]